MVRSLKAIAIRIVFAARKDRAIVRKAKTISNTALHALATCTHLALCSLRGLFGAVAGRLWSDDTRGYRFMQPNCVRAMAMQPCRVAVRPRSPVVVERGINEATA